MDFLFDYYPYSPGRLGTWHPGLGMRLEGDWEPSSNADAYTHDGATWGVDPLTIDRARLALALGVLKGTHGRAAQHSCFGMHEWAMVYRTSPSDVRHESESLRLSPTEIAGVVDDVGLRCTHIDAFRFFTTKAEPLNEHTPTRARQANDEQPGCIHANMDLYKYAMWFQPYIPGNLVVDCFELSVYAREIDMRASPYDLKHLGYAPIAVGNHRWSTRIRVGSARHRSEGRFVEAKPDHGTHRRGHSSICIHASPHDKPRRDADRGNECGLGNHDDHHRRTCPSRRTRAWASWWWRVHPHDTSSGVRRGIRPQSRRSPRACSSWR